MRHCVTMQVLSNICEPYDIEIDVEAANEEEAKSKANIEALNPENKLVKNHYCGETICFKIKKVEQITG